MLAEQKKKLNENDEKSVNLLLDNIFNLTKQDNWSKFAEWITVGGGVSVLVDNNLIINPNSGEIYLNGDNLNTENLYQFATVMTDKDREEIQNIWEYDGNLAGFIRYRETKMSYENENDVDYMPHLKYLVSRFNSVNVNSTILFRNSEIANKISANIKLSQMFPDTFISKIFDIYNTSDIKLIKLYNYENVMKNLYTLNQFYISILSDFILILSKILYIDPKVIDKIFFSQLKTILGTKFSNILSRNENPEILTEYFKVNIKEFTYCFIHCWFNAGRVPPHREKIVSLIPNLQSDQEIFEPSIIFENYESTNIEAVTVIPAILNTIISFLIEDKINGGWGTLLNTGLNSWYRNLTFVALNNDTVNKLDLITMKEIIYNFSKYIDVYVSSYKIATKKTEEDIKVYDFNQLDIQNYIDVDNNSDDEDEDTKVKVNYDSDDDDDDDDDYNEIKTIFKEENSVSNDITDQKSNVIIAELPSNVNKNFFGQDNVDIKVTSKNKNKNNTTRNKSKHSHNKINKAKLIREKIDVKTEKDRMINEYNEKLLVKQEGEEVMLEEVKDELSFELKNEMDTNEKFDVDDMDYSLLEDVNVNDLLEIQDSIVTDISDIIKNERSMMSEEEQSIYELLKIEAKSEYNTKKEVEDYYAIKKEEPMDTNVNNQSIYENIKQEIKLEVDDDNEEMQEIKHEVGNVDDDEEMYEKKYLKRKIIDETFLNIIKPAKLKLDDYKVIRHLELANRNLNNNNIDIDHVISENIKMEEEKQSEFDDFVIKQGPTNPLYKEALFRNTLRIKKEEVKEEIKEERRR